MAQAEEQLKEKMMEEKRYALPIPRGITTGIIFEAAEKFDLEVEQEKPPEDAFDIRTDLPIKDYVPRIIIRGDSADTVIAAQEYILKRHEEWIANLEDWRKMRRERFLKKVKKY